ncbi:hypothetical protein LZ32DRAFT_56836 [Colletotrichum eremochloae]|nr:hypothetical protein LZ32DRAFT_56836 [Colletotrichum eremochloae]
MFDGAYFFFSRVRMWTEVPRYHAVRCDQHHAGKHYAKPSAVPPPSPKRERQRARGTHTSCQAAVQCDRRRPAAPHVPLQHVHVGVKRGRVTSRAGKQAFCLGGRGGGGKTWINRARSKAAFSLYRITGTPPEGHTLEGFKNTHGGPRLSVLDCRVRDAGVTVPVPMPTPSRLSFSYEHVANSLVVTGYNIECRLPE